MYILLKSKLYIYNIVPLSNAFLSEGSYVLRRFFLTEKSKDFLIWNHKQFSGWPFTLKHKRQPFAFILLRDVVTAFFLRPWRKRTSVNNPNKDLLPTLLVLPSENVRTVHFKSYSQVYVTAISNQTAMYIWFENEAIPLGKTSQYV